MDKIKKELNSFLEYEVNYLKAFYAEDSETYDQERKQFLPWFDKALFPARRPLKIDEAWLEKQKVHLERVMKRKLFYYGTWQYQEQNGYVFCLSKADKELHDMYYELLFAVEENDKLKFVSSYLWNFPEDKDTSYSEAEQWDYTQGIQFSVWPEIKILEKVNAPDYDKQLHYYNLL